MEMLERFASVFGGDNLVAFRFKHSIERRQHFYVIISKQYFCFHVFASFHLKSSFMPIQLKLSCEWRHRTGERVNSSVEDRRRLSAIAESWVRATSLTSSIAFRINEPS